MATRTVTTLPVIEETVGPEWNGTQGNWDSSRSPIDLIVIHTMDGSWQAANARFNDPQSQVSAHYGIGLDGSRYHWVDEDKTAYHSGDYQVNERSIGIEHEDGGDYNGIRPDILYTASAQLVADICGFYAIPCDRTHIRKHSEVSDKPTACPDALDIDRIVSLAANLLNPPPTTSTPPSLSDDESRALQVLKDAFKTQVSANGQPFGNLEGLAREAVADITLSQSQAKQLTSQSTVKSPVAPISRPPTPPTTSTPLNPLTQLIALLSKWFAKGGEQQ